MKSEKYKLPQKNTSKGYRWRFNRTKAKTKLNKIKNPCKEKQSTMDLSVVYKSSHKKCYMNKKKQK